MNQEQNTQQEIILLYKDIKELAKEMNKTYIATLVLAIEEGIDEIKRTNAQIKRYEDEHGI